MSELRENISILEARIRELETAPMLKGKEEIGMFRDCLGRREQPFPWKRR